MNMMCGQIGILNVGAGDTKLSFDPKNKGEVKRASATVKDMLKRGYAIFVEVGANEKGPIYQRATGFDAKTAEYLIVGTPDGTNGESNEQDTPSPAPRRTYKTRAGKTRVPAAKTSAVAVARTAGG